MRASQLRTTAALAITLAALAHAQQTQPAVPTDTIGFVDKNTGFSVSVPAGWIYDRTARPAAGGATSVVRGTSPDSRGRMQILVYDLALKPEFERWIEAFAARLQELEGTLRVATESFPQATPPYGYITVDAMIDVERTRTYFYCREMAPGRIWIYSLAQRLRRETDATGDPVLRDRESVAIPAGFRALAESYRQLFQPALARQFEIAMERGEKFVTEGALREAILTKLRFRPEPQYYELAVNDEVVGYLRREIRRGREPLMRAGPNAKPRQGVHLIDTSWRFADDGTAHFSRMHLFATPDGTFDLAEITAVEIPGEEAESPYSYATRTQLVRERDSLAATFLASDNVSMPEPQAPMRVPENYIGLAWARLLPAILGPEARPMIAFRVYDIETKVLVAHAVEPRGGGAGEQYLYLVREGYSPQTAMIYTDRWGGMRKTLAGPVALRLADGEALRRKFERPRRRAEGRFVLPQTCLFGVEF